MRKLLLAVVVLAGFLVACDDTPTSPDAPKLTQLIATATPTPAPRPAATWVGIWKIANTGNLGALDGYSIEIASHDPVSGEVRGRSIYQYAFFTGALRGTVRGNHIDWQSALNGNPSNTENGSMDMTQYSNGLFLEGFIKIEVQSAGIFGQYNGIALRKE